MVKENINKDYEVIEQMFAQLYKAQEKAKKQEQLEKKEAVKKAKVNKKE